MTAPQQGHAAPNATTPLSWLVGRSALSEEALAVTGGAADGAALLHALLENALAVDAVRLVAAALPPREGVWWAWTAAAHAAKLAGADGEDPLVTEALAATERWIASPDDANRRAAWQAAQKVGLETPAGNAAGAAFMTGGSVAPADVAPVPPPPGIHATMVFVAVVASAAVDPAHFDPLARAFVAQGVEVLRQLGGWDTSVELARAHHDAMLQQHVTATTPPPNAPPAH